MRRILRKIAEDEFSNLGDTSTLADPAVVEDLIDNRQNRRVELSLSGTSGHGGTAAATSLAYVDATIRSQAEPGAFDMEHIVSVGMDADTLKQLDNLRRAHPNVPSRVEVITPPHLGGARQDRRRGAAGRRQPRSRPISSQGHAQVQAARASL